MDQTRGGQPLVEMAYAKINLGLKVLRRREDGYREICTIMQSVDLADVLLFEPAAEDCLTCTDPGLPTGADNLVLRAAELFNRRLSAPRRVHIHLEKNIPVGAGLGGGSADAAAALRGLNRLCGEPLSAAQLRQLASHLGSDVPFLISGGTALARGRGELLEPLRWEGDFCYVLVYPGVAVSTAWAYSQIRPNLTHPSPYLNFITSLSGGRVAGKALLSVLENDFQGLVERVNPIVAELRSGLSLAGAQACSMSGSGSTVYGIFDDRSAAHRACQALQAQGYRSFFCRPV